MNKESWILSDKEQAEIFPPIVICAEPQEVCFPYSLDKSKAENCKKIPNLHRLSMVQQELFELDPAYHDERQAHFDKLPRQLSDYLGKLYKVSTLAPVKGATLVQCPSCRRLVFQLSLP